MGVPKKNSLKILINSCGSPSREFWSPFLSFYWKVALSPGGKWAGRVKTSLFKPIKFFAPLFKRGGPFWGENTLVPKKTFFSKGGNS